MITIYTHTGCAYYNLVGITMPTKLENTKLKVY